MKKSVVLFFIFFISLNAFGQNGVKGGRYFLLLKDKNTISLNAFENNEITEIKTYPISEKSLFTTDQKQRVAILNTANDSVSLYDITSSSELKLSIPFQLMPKTVLLNDDNLFIGVNNGIKMLFQYHIQSGKWYQLEMPKEILDPFKLIDDLVINDSLLIAIDNVVMPKYLLFYHLNSTNKLIFSHFKELKSNGTYEEIFNGRIASNYLGLYSITFSGYIGCHEHITIYNDLDLTSSFVISVEVKEEKQFNDFLLIEDKLIIAHKEKGLGIFEIKDSCFQRVSDKYNINASISEDKVIYKQYENEEIIRLTKIPDNETKIVLTIRNEAGKIRQEVVEV